MIDEKLPHAYRGVDDGRLRCCEVCQYPEGAPIHSGFDSITWAVADDGLGSRPCPCGRCADVHLLGIGQFAQGSGFTVEEATEILAALRCYRTLKGVGVPFPLSPEVVPLLGAIIADVLAERVR